MARDADTATRLLSSFEENWAKSTAGGSGIIVFGALVGAEVRREAVVKVTQGLLEREPLLRAQIVENGKGKLCVQLRGVVGLDSGAFVREKGVVGGAGAEEGTAVFGGDEGGSAGLRQAVVQELNTQFVNAQGNASPPLDVFQVCMYATPPSSAASIIVLRLHNGLLDAHSAHAVARHFLASLSHAHRHHRLNVSAGPHVAASPPPVALPPALEDLLPKGKVSKSLLKKGIDTASYLLKAKNWCLLPFHPSFQQLCQQQQAPPQQQNNGSANHHGIILAPKLSFQSDVVSLSLGQEGTASLFAACEMEGIPWRAALATAFVRTAAGMRGLKGEKLDEFSFSCVMNCRSMLEPKVGEAVLGNYTLSLLVSAKVKEGVEFWDLARHVAATINKDAHKGKQFSRMPLLNMLFSQVLKYPAMTPSSSCRTTLFTFSMDSALDERWGDGYLDVMGTIGPVTSVHFVGPCFLLSETLLQGRELLLSFVYPRPVYSRDQFLKFLNSAIDLLRQSSHKHSC